MTLAMFYPRRKFNGYNFAGIAALAEATAPELILEWGWGRRGEVRRAESGDGFLERGQPAPPHQLGGLRERCKLSQRGPGRSPGRRRVFLYSEPSDCHSEHLSTCCIQLTWLGIQYPHINSWGVRSPAYPRFLRPWAEVYALCSS